MLPHLLAKHPLLVTNDADESRRCLANVWERHRSVPKGRRFAIRWNQVELRKSSLAYVHRPFGIVATCEGPLTDNFRMLLPFAGRIENRINGIRAVLTPSSLVLHAPGQELELEIERFRLLLLSFDGQLVRKAMARSFPAMPPLETWAAEFQAHTPAAASLVSLSRWLAGELDRPDSIFRARQRAAASIERTLLALFMEVLAGQRPKDRYARSDLACGQMALIEAWIDANLSEAFGVEDLADVAEVSSRSVQLAFARRRGCTPMQFVLQRRLEQALLLAPTPATTVTGVAMDCGCFHLSRFAASYQSRLGESRPKPWRRLGGPALTALRPKCRRSAPWAISRKANDRAAGYG